MQFKVSFLVSDTLNRITVKNQNAGNENVDLNNVESALHMITVGYSRLNRINQKPRLIHYIAIGR